MTYRLEQIEELRRRVVALRADATYWRRRGRRQTAAELERVAGFTARLADELTCKLDAWQLAFDRRSTRMRRLS